MLENQPERNNEHYSHFSADTKDIMVEFETIMKDCLKFHDPDTTGLFLSALGDVFEVNTIVFQSVGSVGLLICKTKKIPSRKLCTLEETSHYPVILSSIMGN